MEIREISDSFCVKVVERECLLEPALQAQVDSIWDEHGTGLFDGQILSASSVADDEIVAHLVPYRQFFAGEKDSALRKKLGICALAVTGITRSPQGELLLGCRSANVTQYPNCWEMAPSGSLDASCIQAGFADFRQQLLSELTEETGLEMVSGCIPRFLAQREGLIDLCLELKVQGIPSCPSGEYQSLRWMDEKGVSQLEGEWAPLARILLKKVL